MTQTILDNGTGMRISAGVLEDVCKRIIEIILFCLPDAFRGTVYSVGPMPDLRTVRIATGRKEGPMDEIIWGALNPSDYDPPGKVWDVYRDRPGGILEAMAWCVDKQKSWTADYPEDNIRCVRKQLEGKAVEDYHHMEPVLVKKSDLWGKIPSLEAFPEDSSGIPIWKDSLYATVAVIKIHFLPRTIKQGDRSTKIIKELSHSLGTEMLSLHAREVVLEKEQKLAKERQETCNTIAHEFRNIMTRMGFTYRAVNNEISYLREYWESLIRHYNPQKLDKKKILENLNQLLQTLREDNGLRDTSSLLRYQNQLMLNSFLPKQSTIWLQQKIKPLWMSVLAKNDISPDIKGEVESCLENLEESFYMGLDQKLIDKIEGLSNDLKLKWSELVYKEIDGNSNGLLKEYIELLDGTRLEIPHKRQTLKNFTYFKGLIELLPDIEEKLNDHLDILKDGNKPSSFDCR